MEFELQFTPTRTASADLKESVEREFAAAAIPVKCWTVPLGEDRELPAGMKWAEPTLDIRITSDEDAAQVLARLSDRLGDVLSRLQEQWPTLGLAPQVIARDRQIGFAVRQADGPGEWIAALRALRTFELQESNVYGWDSKDRKWFAL